MVAKACEALEANPDLGNTNLAQPLYIGDHQVHSSGCAAVETDLFILPTESSTVLTQGIRYVSDP